MTAVPSDVEAERGPPMAVPLRHFVVALALLLAGAALGALHAADAAPGRAGLAHVHLLLAGWVCVTIMGAMTQFVPVWSGVDLHSRRLASAQLPLVVAGLLLFAAALLTGAQVLLPVGGAAMLAGFWAFAYNVGRSLAAARPLDVTERHFALALACLLGVTGMGLLLAVGVARPRALAALPVTRFGLRAAHATLAVFGVVLLTVAGALYQLGPMFTQCDLAGVDRHLRRLEEAGYPLGVLALTAGRLVDHAALARAGAVLVCAGLLALAVVLGRRLRGARVAWTPMLSRYAVAALALALWVGAAAPAWVQRPLAGRLFGPPGAAHLLLVGGVGFVVLGTLYHVVPFVVWVHRYSDRLGLEAVPAVDDLYDDRIAAADFWATVAGTALLVAGPTLDRPALLGVGGAAFLLGTALFAGNLLLVLRRHSPHAVADLLAPGVAERVRRVGERQ